MTGNYTDRQVESVLYEVGVEVVSESQTDIFCFCPYHRNTDTYAFSVNRSSGAFMCFAPHCGETGNLLKLVLDKRGCNVFVAKRLIERFRGEEPSITQQLEDIFIKQDELPKFDRDILNKLYDDMWNSPGQDYMINRGFEDKTLAYFEIGYSVNKAMVTIPMHDWNGNPVGIIGRTIEGKRFKNSKNLPTKKVLFNTHRAKKYDSAVIIVESSMDAMRVHQAGFPCVVATNGSIFSDNHIQTINRYWNDIIIMTDFDDINDHRDPFCRKCENTCQGHNAGRVLGEKMVKSLPNKRIKWASYDYGVIYPHNAKDAGDMTIEEIQQCIKNAVSDIEYILWKHDFPLLSTI